MNRREKILKELLFAILTIGGITVITLAIILTKYYFVLKHNQPTQNVCPSIYNLKSAISILNQYMEENKGGHDPPILFMQTSLLNLSDKPP